MPTVNGLQTTNGVASEFEGFARLFSDFNRQWTVAQMASKHEAKLRRELQRFSGGSSEYGSQELVLKDQIKKAQQQGRQATEEAARLSKQLEAAFYAMLPSGKNQPSATSQTSAAAPLTNGAVQGSEKSLENRLAFLENKQKADLDDQKRRLHLLETKSKIEKEGQKVKIEGLENKLAGTTEQLSDALREIKQLKSDLLEQKSRSQEAPPIHKAPEILDLRAYMKTLENQLKGLEVKTRRVDAHHTELADMKTKFQSHPRHYSSKDELKAHANTQALKMTGLEESLKGLQKSLEDQVVNANANNTQRKEEHDALAFQVTTLESATVKREEFQDIEPDHLKSMMKRDWASEIEQEVKKQVASMPPSPALHRSVSTGSPAPPPAGQEASIAAAVTAQLQGKLDVVKQKLGPLITNEREGRAKLEERVEEVVKNAEALSTRVAAIETKSPAPQSDIDQNMVGRVQRDLDAKYDTLNNHLQSQINDVLNNTSKIGSGLENLSAQHEGLRGYSERAYQQLAHEHCNMQTALNNFTTREMYPHIVKTLQELVPNGMTARVTAAEIRLDNIENAVLRRHHQQQQQQQQPNWQNQQPQQQSPPQPLQQPRLQQEQPQQQPNGIGR